MDVEKLNQKLLLCLCHIETWCSIAILKWSVFRFKFPRSSRLRMRTNFASSLKSAMQSEILRKRQKVILKFHFDVDIAWLCVDTLAMAGAEVRSKPEGCDLERTQKNPREIFAISTNIDKSHNSFSLPHSYWYRLEMIAEIIINCVYVRLGEEKKREECHRPFAQSRDGGCLSSLESFERLLIFFRDDFMWKFLSREIKKLHLHLPTWV